jgi:ribosomal protein S18 acetylase RimI-like enzyme
MYAFFDNEKIIGYYSLSPLSDQECELNNLCVLPSSRHKGIGQALLEHSFETAGALGYEKMKIGIVEENKVLKAWYISFGFLPIGTKTLVSLPFTCGFLEKPLK